MLEGLFGNICLELPVGLLQFIFEVISCGKLLVRITKNCFVSYVFTYLKENIQILGNMNFSYSREEHYQCHSFWFLGLLKLLPVPASKNCCHRLLDLPLTPRPVGLFNFFLETFLHPFYRHLY